MKTSTEIARTHEAGGTAGPAALLPWESEAEYRVLYAAFASDHAPEGATEQTLVARLVWIEWRRRRLVLAERAVHMAALADRISSPTRTT
ncbi:MAG: hypothetical protein R3C30_15015 [Hyphomonadaceae bacterium]